MKNKNKFSRFFRGFLIAIFWLVIWEIAYLAVQEEILIVSPLTVFRRILELIANPEFWVITFSSIGRIILGFLFAVAAGVIIAILTTSIPLVYSLFYPVIGVIKATPITSFIILALVWIKSSGVPVFMAFLMVFPIIWANVSEGIKNADKNLLEMASVYNFRIYKKVIYIYIPSVMPYFISAFKTGLGFSWKAGIAAEVIGTPDDSIGEQLYNSKIYLETADLFAWTLVVIALSIVIEKSLVKLISYMSSKFFVGK